jgi:YVTN family beta-propeller protein
MDTLAYLHLATTYEASANPQAETARDYGLFFQELHWVKWHSKASILLIFFAIALASLSLSSPALALQKGNSSSQVTSLQKKLQAAGYFDGPVTGYYGSLTQAAVMKFQKAQGLTANGIADLETLKALNSGSKASAPEQPAAPQKVVSDDPVVSPRPAVTLKRGNSSTQVTSLQKKLQAAGYFDGPLTGYYGSLTQAAVIKFQKAHGLTPNGIADLETLNALESGSKAPSPTKPAAPKSKSATPSPSKPAASQSKTKAPSSAKPAAPASVVTESPKLEAPPNLDKPQKTSERPQTRMKLKKTISGKISPKSVVSSGTGLFFAQNMMYSHTITVYDREHNLVKTIPDAVNLSKYGYSKFKGNYRGAPVETSFSHDGKYAWVSNYQMYGPGFNNPGSDQCSPSQKTDKSFLYRINTETLKIEKVIQVGSVPKYVATAPDNRLVLVSNWCSWDLSVVDTEKNRETKRIPLGRYPRGIVVDATSDKAYIAVMGSEDIAKVDLEDFSVGWLKNIGHSPRHLNLDPSGEYLYTTLNGEGRIAKIDLSTGKVLKKVVTGNAPRSMVISDDGQQLYVVNYYSNTVSKVRTSDMKVLQTVNVGASPIGITYDPQTREVWVACYSGSIMVFQD